ITVEIGVAVNAVRKHCSDEEVVALAKILIKNWKRLLGERVCRHFNIRSVIGQYCQLDNCQLPLWEQTPCRMENQTSRIAFLLTCCVSRFYPHASCCGVQAPYRSVSGDLRRSLHLPFQCLCWSCTHCCFSFYLIFRRPSTGSNPAASPTSSWKSFSDGKEERYGEGGKSKPETPSTPSSPTFISTNCFLASCYLTGDLVRDKCVEMISAALKMDDDYKEFGVDCDKMAAEIEDHILWSTDMKYRNRVRSRISNLKDPKNPNLRRNVLCGGISASLIARMTAEEMASDELKELRNAMTLEAIREHQMAKTSGTVTDLFQCSKCKKKNCSYNQVQTRSADEPMTTFVLCNECGNRWKVCILLFPQRQHSSSRTQCLFSLYIMWSLYIHLSCSILGARECKINVFQPKRSRTQCPFQPFIAWSRMQNQCLLPSHTL
uniref:Transcription elongation factor A3 n=1 Tax=Sphenodon punctatus TaxID=8508 RepID=A0A8D0GSY6_SPHPU